MQLLTIILILLMVGAIVVIAAITFDLPLLPRLIGDNTNRSSLRSIVASQRSASSDRGSSRFGTAATLASALRSTSVEQKRKPATSELTLEKKLKYATWKMPPAVFRTIEISLSVVAVSAAHFRLNIILQAFVLFSGPIFMRWLLTRAIERRFKAFDADYPQFLMSLVGLLKTGMNPMTGIEAAAQGLEDGSLVRSEVILMLERLRFGVPEEKSIGSFGEDIYHQEIELFVQALILSRRVGGTLSDTLERLARQVRRRQYFRESAQAAVGMQRGSIWFIVGILGVFELYLTWIYPEAVDASLNTDVGWQVVQTGIALILLGVFWVRQVTKIRV
jgi:tight adherence protein B